MEAIIKIQLTEVLTQDELGILLRESESRNVDVGIVVMEALRAKARSFRARQKKNVGGAK